MRNTYLWLAQLVTGVLIAVLLGIHMVGQHLNDILGITPEPTAWQSMIGRAGQGVWVALYVALLAFGLYHGIYGLRNIILETTSSPRTGRAVTLLLVVLGVAVFAGGTYVPVVLLSR